MKRKTERFARRLQRPRLEAQKTVEPEKARDVRRERRVTTRQHRRRPRR